MNQKNRRDSRRSAFEITAPGFAMTKRERGSRR
jgi:hypothetical protein